MPVIAAIGLAMIFGHNLLDKFDATELGNNPLWDVIHRQLPISYGVGNTFFVIYPLVPWIA